jgi:hypothetical protein
MPAQIDTEMPTASRKQLRLAVFIVLVIANGSGSGTLPVNEPAQELCRSIVSAWGPIVRDGNDDYPAGQRVPFG